MLRTCLTDTCMFSDKRTAAIATDDIVGSQSSAFAPFSLNNYDIDAVSVLNHILCGPSVQGLNCWYLTGAPSQNGFGRVLRQSLVVSEVKGTNELSLHPVIRIVAEERLVGGQPI